MDQEQELGKFKWLLAAAVAFLISGIASFSEFRYALFAKTADAQVTKTYESGTRGLVVRRTSILTVDYTFTDDGTLRTEHDDMPLDWQLPPGGRVPVEYLAGSEGSSRIAGHKRIWPIVVFAICLAVVVFFGYRLWREAHEAVKDIKPRRPGR